MFTLPRKETSARAARRATGGASRQAALIARIRAALEKETRINLHRFPIALSFDGGDLVFAGNVEHIGAKKIALQLAAAAPGLRIVDRLRITPAAVMGDRKIRVATKDWVVTLEGLVPNQTMKQMAERDAWYVLGVKDVVNQLQVKW